MESIIQKLLGSCGAEIISSAPEYHITTNIVAGAIRVFAIVLLLLLLMFICSRFSGTFSRVAIFALGYAVVLSPALIIWSPNSEEPTGKMLYTIIASEQTDMAAIQQNFDIVENVTYRTFTVRIKDDLNVMVDPIAPAAIPATKDITVRDRDEPAAIVDPAATAVIPAGKE